MKLPLAYICIIIAAIASVVKAHRLIAIPPYAMTGLFGS